MLLCFILLVFSLTACGLVEQPVVTSIPSVIPTVVPTPTSTLIPTLEPTTTPTSIPQSVPTTTPTQPLEQIGMFHRVTSLIGLVSDPSAAMQLHAPADGSVWVVTNWQALRWDGKAWEVVLSEDEQMLATVDDSGRLWLLQQDQRGITAWQDGQWTTYRDDGDWTSAYSSSLAGWWAPESWHVVSSPAGTVWMAMAHDLRVFDGENWRLYTQEDMGFLPQEVEDLAAVYQIAIADDEAEAWVGECYYAPPGPMTGQGVRWFNGQIWQSVEPQIDLTCLSAMFVDSEENVWLASYNTIYQYKREDGSWSSYVLPDTLLLGYSFSHPRHLIVDHVGDVWVIMQLCGGASCDGPANLYRIHDGEWSLIIEAEYWRSPYKQLLLDGSEHAWLFWEGTIYQLDGGSLTTIASISTLDADTSPDGQMWLLAAREGDIELWMLAP